MNQSQISKWPFIIYTAMDVAVHIPLAKIACTSYSQARSSGDNAKAMLVNLLEEE